jgi:hypothetical protein
MARIWNTPVFILATVYFVVDGVFSHVTQPITVWLAKKKLFERVRLWVISLGPYPSLALFAVPFIHHPGAGKALVGVFDRNRSFLRWRCHLHHGGSFEAYIRRAAVSA